MKIWFWLDLILFENFNASSNEEKKALVILNVSVNKFSSKIRGRSKFHSNDYGVNVLRRSWSTTLFTATNSWPLVPFAALKQQAIAIVTRKRTSSAKGLRQYPFLSCHLWKGKEWRNHTFIDFFHEFSFETTWHPKRFFASNSTAYQALVIKVVCQLDVFEANLG